MNLIERIKEKKCENQEERFYQYIDNAKYDLKSAINIEEVEFRYVKMLGALDLARGGNGKLQYVKTGRLF